LRIGLQAAALSRRRWTRTSSTSPSLSTARHTLIDYGRRHRAGKPISSSRAESTVNQLVNARMNKRRQMRWSPVGAHRMLQVRAAVLDGRLHEQNLRAAA